MRFDSSTLYSISDVVPVGEISTTQCPRWISIRYTIFKDIAKGRTQNIVEMEKERGTKPNIKIKVLAT